MSKAARFRKSFSPYGQRYTVKSDDGLFPGWQTINNPLTDQTIERAILGRIVAGYVLTTCPRAIGLDIDDHHGKGSGYVLGILDQVRQRLGGLAPSVLARSPRGLHPFYFLSIPTPWQVLDIALKERLAGLPVEVRPTPWTSLRIPDAAAFIDPLTLTPEQRQYEDILDEAERVHPAELFNQDMLPNQVRATLRERRERFGRLRSVDNMARIETQYAPIQPGNTNDALCKLIPCYRGAGMSPDQAAGYFARLLEPGYTGELLNWHRLLKRVQSYYRDKGYQAYERPRAVQLDLFTSQASNTVATLWAPEVSQGPGGWREHHIDQRRDGIRELTAAILNWRGYIDQVKASPSTSASFDYVYPFFRKNTREGFYPLPRSVMKRADWHYDRYMPFLRAIGFLEPAPYPYVPGAGICKYYRINPERFIGGNS